MTQENRQYLVTVVSCNEFGFVVEATSNAEAKEKGLVAFAEKHPHAVISDVSAAEVKPIKGETNA